MLKFFPDRPSSWLGAVLAFFSSAAFSSDPAPVESQVVRRNLVKSLMFTGELQAVRSTTVSTPALPTKWSFRVAYLAPEGSTVQRGDVLVRFDAEELELKRLDLEKEREEARIRVAEKRAALEVMRQDLLLSLARADKIRAVAQLYAILDPQLIARSDAEQYRFELSKAELELKKARERLAGLEESGRIEIELAKLEFDRADFKLETLKSEIASLTVRAESPGLVIHEELWDGRPVQVGENVYRGWPIIRLPNMNVLRVRAQVYDVDFPHLREGMPAQVAFDAIPGRSFQASVHRPPEIAKPAHQRSRMNVFQVDFLLSETDLEVMKPGMTARVQIALTRPDSLVVPRTAIRLDSSGRTFVSVVGRGPVPVQVLDANERWVAVAGDLSEGLRLQSPAPVRRLSAAAPDWITLRNEELRFTVPGTGILQAESAVELSAAQVSGIWKYRIVELVPEGSRVQPGDLVMRFDSTLVLDRLKQERADLEKAVQERLKTQASLNLQQKDLELQLAEARVHAEKTANKLLQARQFQSSLKLQEAVLEADFAALQVEILEKRLASAARSARLRLQILAESEAFYRNRISKAEEALEAMTVRAPVDGLVIHETDWSNRKKQVGSEVYLMETIVSLPALSTLMIHGQVAEMDSAKVQLGQSVTVSVDAIPDETFRGTVVGIGTILRKPFPESPVKTLEIKVRLESVDVRRMRPEMAARLQILVDRFENVLAVPLSVVQVESGESFVWVRKGGQPTKRAIRLGRDNGLVGVVLEGLAEGDEVAGKPLAFGPSDERQTS